MDDLDARGPRFLEHGVHAPRQFIYALRRASAPMVVPHVANEDGGFRDRKIALERGRLPLVRTLGILHARPERKMQRLRGRERRRQERQDSQRDCHMLHSLEYLLCIEKPCSWRCSPRRFSRRRKLRRPRCWFLTKKRPRWRSSIPHPAKLWGARRPAQGRMKVLRPPTASSPSWATTEPR